MKRFHKRHRHRILRQRRVETLESRLALSGPTEALPDLPDDVFAPPPEVDITPTSLTDLLPVVNPLGPEPLFTIDGDLPFVPLPPAPIGPEGPG